MKEYIEREALLWLIGHRPSSPTTEREDRLINAFISAVENAPAADVREVVRGKWLTTDAFPHHVFCSECKKTYIPNDRWQVWKDKYGDGGLPRDFCPNCGAEMSNA